MVNIKDLYQKVKYIEDLVRDVKEELKAAQQTEKQESKEYQELKQRLKKHEGLRLFPYRDSVGKLTIGYGHNLEDKGINVKIAQALLEEDIQDAIKDLEKLPAESWKHLNERRKYVLVEMIFNMGVRKVLGFKRMLKALTEKDYKKAAAEMLDSKWAKQVGERAKTLAKIMEEG